MKEKAGEDGKDGCPVIRMDPDYIDISFSPNRDDSECSTATAVKLSVSEAKESELRRNRVCTSHITWAVSHGRARDAKARLSDGLLALCLSSLTRSPRDLLHSLRCAVCFFPLCATTSPINSPLLLSSTRLFSHRTYRISNHILSPCLSSRYSGSRCSTTLPLSLHLTSSRSLLSVSSSFKKVRIP